MSTLQKDLYFYSPEGLALVKHTGAGASALLRGAGRALAQRNGGQAAFYAMDEHGSILQFPPCSLQYTVYGFDGNEQCATVLRYSGQKKESVTGHYLLGEGYRALNPGLMRFNSPDSLSPMGAGGINCYAYCGGDPVNNTDPSGHIVVPKVKLPSIRPKAGSTKSGYSINPDFNGGKSAPRVLGQHVVKAVDALGRGYGNQIEPIMNAAIWSDGQKLLVEGSVLTLSTRIAKKGWLIDRTPVNWSSGRNWLIAEREQNLEAFVVLDALHSRMKAAEEIPQVNSWLHDPKRLSQQVRDPGKAG
ncbi:RHS repeat-associated core domain-containing protein [Pseudomonas asiatica]|uniref:RHS repeat-associated core domain-containing protein n=1 Tax=Pseudomonas asiatica TaxID=2219225 RepID=UPI00209B6C11|nr:RHS repeat-associated core domain-containing protein [Pseudomonas asiatica]MCO7536986.1 RHS repeat-associated core domain-containing protein [Pseudomonas asiatica]MCO7550672.1 RHS repeat-associated core domain-containing protein [Pseudomonas asiatica]MCO7562823.1 RHS repeat-associated core domain-containing protein [Pseudomonas asiatica]